MHYGLAVATGAAYTLSARKLPMLRLGGGSAFGAAIWLIGDEVAVSAAGLENPLLAPISAHCSALTAHIAYGMVLDAFQSLLDV